MRSNFYEFRLLVTFPEGVTKTEDELYAIGEAIRDNKTLGLDDFSFNPYVKRKKVIDRKAVGFDGQVLYGLDVMGLAKALVEIAGIGTSCIKIDWFCDNSPADTRAANSTQNIEKEGKYGYTKYIINGACCGSLICYINTGGKATIYNLKTTGTEKAIYKPSWFTEELTDEN